MAKPMTDDLWNVGDRVHHETWGDGMVMHVFDEQPSPAMSVRFPGIGQKIFACDTTKLQRIQKAD